jgi:hypothetical protein
MASLPSEWDFYTTQSCQPSIKQLFQTFAIFQYLILTKRIRIFIIFANDLPFTWWIKGKLGGFRTTFKISLKIRVDTENTKWVGSTPSETTNSIFHFDNKVIFHKEKDSKYAWGRGRASRRQATVTHGPSYLLMLTDIGCLAMILCGSP